MLNVADIVRALNDEVSLTISSRGPSSGIKGLYDPILPRIFIYPTNAGSRHDLGITVLHEFIHHKRKSGRSHRLSVSEEKSIESEAIETYKKRSYLLSVIKELYKLKTKSF